jgi:hypothetical protein
MTNVDVVTLDAEIEQLIDRYTLKNVLAAAARVAGEKACHVAANWQDTQTAKVWEKACHAVDVTAERVKLLGV